MSFIGGGATNYQQWLDFLGLVKDARPVPVGSPFQQNFHRAAVEEDTGEAAEKAGAGPGLGEGDAGRDVDRISRRRKKRKGGGGKGAAGAAGEDEGDGDDQGDGREEGFDGAVQGRLAACDDNALRCSCADCPAGAGCAAPSGDDDAPPPCMVRWGGGLKVP